MSQNAQSTGSMDRVSPFRTIPLALLRIGIGWHFLYEGIVKLLDPDWSAGGFLGATSGPLSGVFHWMADNPMVLRIVDLLNIWGLVLIGVCLMLGVLTRLSAFAGVALLALYYAAYPPLFSAAAIPMAEGHYLIVNKNLVELLALLVVVVFPTKSLGLDAVLFSWMRRRSPRQIKGEPSTAAPDPRGGKPSRRQVLLSLTGVPFVGALGFAAFKKQDVLSREEEHLVARLSSTEGVKPDAISGATKAYDWSQMEDLKDKIPTAKIGELELSRVILGGNLIGGWAHARDLLYVSKLVKAYHHREKIFETFRLAEACGINTFLANPVMFDALDDYWKNGGGKIQFISDCGGGPLLEMIQKSIDHGASACYIHGGVADGLVKKGNFDPIEKGLELIRKNGLPAGIGGHYLETVKGCVEQGFEPDFWMKTLHHTDYWSATPTRERDNLWCEQPEETIAFMKDLAQPWLAYKVLAAGAIHPEDGFKYAFEGGADFICVGMYDFQIVDDVNIALDVLNGELKRERPFIV